MRAILLAAGYGTRLQPLTKTIPKCLVPIKGIPLLEIWLQKLKEAGISKFCVNSHYLAEQVEAFIQSSPYRHIVKLVNEPMLLGTAGTLNANINFYQGQDGLLIHADNYCCADLNAFVLAHRKRPSQCLMTMMTFRTDSPSSCGIVELDESGVVIGFYEKSSSHNGNLANGAIYILSSELLVKIAKELQDAKDFSTEIIQHLIGRIYSYETTEVFIDIGTIDNYEKANLS